MKKFIAGMLIASMALFVCSAYAKDAAKCSVPSDDNPMLQTKTENYEEAALHKLSRGGKNVLGAPADVPEETYQIGKKESIPEGIIFGPLEGSLKMVGRVIFGIIDVLTFPIAPRQKATIEPENPGPTFDEKIHEALW